MRKHENEKGAVLIEVMVSLFITAMVFIAVYTTISVSLVNTRYLQQTKETSGFASQLAEAFYACAESDAYTMFDYISETHTDVPGATEIDMEAVQRKMNAARQSGEDVAHIDNMIDEVNMTDYNWILDLLYWSAAIFSSAFLSACAKKSTIFSRSSYSKTFLISSKGKSISCKARTVFNRTISCSV